MASYLKVGYVEVKQAETQKSSNQKTAESQLIIIDDIVQWSCYEPISGELYKDLHNIEIFGVNSYDVLVDQEPTTSKGIVIVNEDVRRKLQEIIKIYVDKLQKIEANVPLSEEIKKVLRSLAVLTKALDCCDMGESNKLTDEKKKQLIITIDF